MQLVIDYFTNVDDACVISLEISDDLIKKRLFKVLDAAMIRLEGGIDQDLEILETIYGNKNAIEEKSVDTKAPEKEEEEEEKEDVISIVQKEEENSNGEIKTEQDLDQNKKLTENCQTFDTEIKKNDEKLKTTVIVNIPQKTQSIFFKHLPVIVTRSDLEKIGSKYPGFKRASISEPAPERRFQRRGWITFDSTINIKEVCSKINGTRLHDMMLNAAINRDIDQKIKLISGLANQREIIRNDLKLACRIVDNMDKRWGLWNYSQTYEETKKKEEEELTKIDFTYKKKNKGKEANPAPAAESVKTDVQVKEDGENSDTALIKEDEKSNGAKPHAEASSSGDEAAKKTPISQVDGAEVSNTKNTNGQMLEKNPLVIAAQKYLEHLSELSRISKEQEVADALIQKQIETAQNESKANVTVDIVKAKNVEEQNAENEEEVKSKNEEVKPENEEVKDEIDCKVDEEQLEKSDKDKDDETKQKNTTQIETPKPSQTATATIKPNPVIQMEKDEEAAKYLDKLIIYLRVVHSIDYYNATEYQQEDWMPNRLGILHVRASADAKIPSSEFQITNVINGQNISTFDKNNLKKAQIDEWLRLFEIHVKPYVEYRERVEYEIAKRLGVKDTKEEFEAFMTMNCKKIEKNVWLCPLSGKKFKGPDYVRKHIETKQTDKLEELKRDIDYFNRFIYDPKRPYLPEHPLNKSMNNQNFNNFNNNQMNPFNNNNNNNQHQFSNAYGIASSDFYNNNNNNNNAMSAGYRGVGAGPNMQGCGPYSSPIGFGSGGGGGAGGYSNAGSASYIKNSFNPNYSQQAQSGGYQSGYSNMMTDEYNSYPHSNHYNNNTAQGYYSSSSIEYPINRNQMPMHQGGSGYGNINRYPKR
jgi:hypothetical protein